MNGQALIFRALWIGTASIGSCNNGPQIVKFGYADGSGAATELRVIVNVYNSVNLPLDDLSQAEHEAARIFVMPEFK